MFEPRGHDVMSGSILYPPTRDDCDIAILFIETSGCLPMCGHGTIGTVTMAIEHGLVKPKTPGMLRLDTPAGLVVAEYRQVGELCRGGAHHQCAVLPLCRGADGRMPGARRDQRRRRLWRQFLRDRRAAAELSRHGRLFGRRPDRLEPGRAAAAQREVQLRAPGEPGDQPAVAHAVDRRADESGGRRAQRRVLRRQGDRPLALRHRHLGADGAAARQGQAQGRRRLRPRIDHRLAVQGPGREARRPWPASRPSSRRSAAGRG